MIIIVYEIIKRRWEEVRIIVESVLKGEEYARNKWERRVIKKE